MLRMLVIKLLAACYLMSVSHAVCAQERFRFPEARHVGGELVYVHEVPVAIVGGTPEEIGDQLGQLVLKPARELTHLGDDFLEQQNLAGLKNVLLGAGGVFTKQFPEDALAELQAAARTSEWPENLLVFGNVVTDLRHLVHCSTMTIEPVRSTTGGTLFGRNLDWPSIGRLPEFTYVMVARPTGKKAFASVTFPGMLGCTSAMNEAGLALAMLDVTDSKDEATYFNPQGIPTHYALRRIMEECATIEDAVELMRSIERASLLNISISDRTHAAVIEVTPKTVFVRSSENGVCLCTNEFLTPELGTRETSRRFDILEQSLDEEKVSVQDLWQRLDLVNQGDATLQSMVFEPTPLRLHLAFGYGPATKLKLQTVDLKPLFAKKLDSE